MRKFAVREWAELISDPITMGNKDQQVFKHADLPVVSNELSITLRIKLKSYTSSWATIFHKGTEDLVRTPGLWLSANKDLHARFTGNWNNNAGICGTSDQLLLNKWYHLTYTLSDSEKRLDFYIDSEWVGFYSIQNVKTQNVIFNDGPLYIGRGFSWDGFNGEISDVHYFNWRLPIEEVKKDFFKSRPILYGSKVAFIHVSTGKYLSTKGVKYDLGPDNQQYMVVCNDQKIDLKNDIWIVDDAHDRSTSAGSPVSFNTILGFRHKATGVNLHSHHTNVGTTPKSKQQQVTLCTGRNADDDWLIRRYSPNDSYDDSGHLKNGDIISLFHITTNKPALYSDTILLDDGSQEVSCHGNGNEENNKWCIELIG